MLNVIKRDGRTEAVDRKKIFRAVERACKGLEDVSPQLITNDAHAQLFPNIRTEDIERATVLAAVQRIPSEPNYSLVAARLLLQSIYREAFGRSLDQRRLASDYKRAFKENLHLLVQIGRFDPRMIRNFDLDRLADALRPERDDLLKYLAVRTLQDRYINHIDGRRLEPPQAFWMRVAMGVSILEPDPTASAIRLYDLYSQLCASPATPTLLNSGKAKPQLSSCFGSTMEDSIDGIYGTLHSMARLSKHGGGLGLDITPLRGINSFIKGTNGFSQGSVPWARQVNDMVVAVNQGGSRKGACALYLETWHIDIEDFIELRKVTGDERRRCHDINTANWIPDEFMRRVEADAEWTLFSPDDVPGLHESFGEKFVELYSEYERRAKEGAIKNVRVVKAKDLWRKMLTVVKETGHPWLTFKDAANVPYQNQHAGPVLSSQLCVEIMQHSIPTKWGDGEVIEVGETYVCNLLSVNVSAYAGWNGEIDFDNLAIDVKEYVRTLDNVITLNYYPTRETANANQKYRPVGLGVMGWHDLLLKKNLPFDSDEAVALAGELQEFVAYHATLASIDLAAQRGAYPGYEGSNWSKGIFPHEAHAEFLRGHRGATDISESRQDWEHARRLMAQYGIRNSLLQACAPTATIANFLGCSEGIGPITAPLYVYGTISGDFVVLSELFVAHMKRLGKWTAAFAAELARNDGDVSGMDLPEEVKRLYRINFDIDQKKMFDATAARQLWIDQGQSHNVYYRGKSLREMSEMYFHAWRAGLKSTYYLHTEAASKVTKHSSVAVEHDGAQDVMVEAVDQLPERTCPIDGSCESCA